MLYGKQQKGIYSAYALWVLILIFLENALRQSQITDFVAKIEQSLNPYFFGKCSTA